MFKNSINFSPAIWLVLIMLMLLAVVSSNPVFTILALLFPPIAAKLLWKKNEPPVLFLGLTFQWLQVTIKVFYADIYNVSLTSVADFPLYIEDAFLLCLGALFVVAFGIFLSIKSYSFPPVSHLNKLAGKYKLNSVTLLYIVFSAAAPIVLGISPGGLIQFVYKLVDFKWAIFFIFYSLTFLKNTKKYNFYVIISIEIILGFTGYFSGFKDFFLFVAICYLTIKQSLKASQYALLGISAVLVFNIMVIWQTVKSDYRAYLSGGIQAQIVTVSKSEALNVLSYKVSTMTKEDYQKGMRQLVDRISYIGFFSAVRGYVPDHLGFENGRLWSEALLKVVTPRILFPNKAVIDDSEKTRKYTGRSYAGASEGTSISLGYITESYIDFGPIFMFFPLFFFGLFIGWMYSYIIRNTYNQLLGYASVIPIFFQIYTFELALDKAVGALVAYLVVYLVVRKFALPPIERFLSQKSNYNTPREYSARQRLV